MVVRDNRSLVGSPWVDNVLPLTVGLSCALIVIYGGAPLWTLLLLPLLCWCFWHLARWLEGRLAVRILLVTSLATAIVVYVYVFFRVDTSKLREEVSAAGIEVNAVSSNRNGVFVSIRPVSWGPERNIALRAIFAAAHTHARSRPRIKIQWGDAMITTVKMKDIDALMRGKITYREMLNRMKWSGTPEILPDDSSGSRGA